jgi:hypothetical protein
MDFARMKSWTAMLALACLCGCRETPGGHGRAWDRRADSLALLQHGQIVWRFNFGANEAKPNFQVPRCFQWNGGRIVRP